MFGRGVAEIETVDMLDDVHGRSDQRKAPVHDEHVVDVTPVRRPTRPLVFASLPEQQRDDTGAGLETVKE